MSSLQFTMLPAPEILKNDVECLRIAEYSGEEAVAIKAFSGMTPTSLTQQVDDFHHEQAGYASV
jgi:hypothetical protein